MNININLLKNIRCDFFGGITAGIIALPLALAFGVASGLGAAAGLYGAILVCLFATIFGGTPTQISGPTGPMTVVVAAIAASHPGNYKLIFMTIFLAGIFQIILGISKIAKLIHYVPYPVISGFMSGIGIIIIILQLNPLLGLELQGNTIDSLVSFFTNISSVNFQSLILGILTLAIVFFTPKQINKKIPSALIALFAVSIISVLFGFNVPEIGTIPASFPKIQLGMLSADEFSIIIPSALTLALLGSIDSLLTSLVADSLTKTKHNSVKELIGQGIGNMAASLFGGLAGAGATMRTVVNIKSGGTTRLSGIIHSAFLILVLFFLAPYASKIPLAVLAGILIKVGFDIIDYKILKILKSAPRYDLIVMFFVLFITVIDDLIFAVGVGIVLSSILFAASITSQTDINVEEIDNCDCLSCPEESCKYQIMMFKINGIFFFGTASQIIEKVEELLDTKCLIINCKNIKDIDLSAFFALEEIIYKLNDNNIEPFLILNNSQLTRKLIKLGLLNFIARDNITYTEEKAIEKAKQYLADCSQNS